jgi:hypothetical protein
MNIFARQGDLVVRRAPKPFEDTADFRRRTGFVLAGDSSGHRHRLKGPALVRERVDGVDVRLTKATTLGHEKCGGHKAVTLPAGDYEITRKRERGGQGDRAVQD